MNIKQTIIFHHRTAPLSEQAEFDKDGICIEEDNDEIFGKKMDEVIELVKMQGWVVVRVKSNIKEHD